MAGGVRRPVRTGWREAGRPGDPQNHASVNFAIGDQHVAEAGRRHLAQYYGFKPEYAKLNVDDLITSPQDARDTVRAYARSGVRPAALPSRGRGTRTGRPVGRRGGCRQSGRPPSRRILTRVSGERFQWSTRERCECRTTEAERGGPQRPQRRTGDPDGPTSRPGPRLVERQPRNGESRRRPQGAADSARDRGEATGARNPPGAQHIGPPHRRRRGPPSRSRRGS